MDAHGSGHVLLRGNHTAVKSIGPTTGSYSVERLHNYLLFCRCRGPCWLVCSQGMYVHLFPLRLLFRVNPHAVRVLYVQFSIFCAAYIVGC